MGQIPSAYSCHYGGLQQVGLGSTVSVYLYISGVRSFRDALIRLASARTQEELQEPQCGGLCYTTPCHLCVWNQRLGVKEVRQDIAPTQPASDLQQRNGSQELQATYNSLYTAEQLQLGAGNWRSCFIHPNCFSPLQKSTLPSAEAVQFPLVQHCAAVLPFSLCTFTLRLIGSNHKSSFSGVKCG